MADALIAVSDDGAIRTVTVQRPDKLNALNAATLQALAGAFSDAAADPEVRVVVLTGAGPKAFVAGADIAEMNTLSAVQGRDFSLLGQALMRQIERMPKPVIARVNGFALGGGLELAMACHLRIAADTAKVGQPEINLGLIPGFGGSQRLLRLCGRATTLELCLLGRRSPPRVRSNWASSTKWCPPTRWTIACRTLPASWHARPRWPCVACSMRCTWAANAARTPGWSTKARSSACCSPPRTCAKAPAPSCSAARRRSRTADAMASRPNPAQLFARVGQTILMAPCKPG